MTGKPVQIIESKPYIPVPTMERFHASRALTRFVRGPRGSGKSYGIVKDIKLRADYMPPLRGTHTRSSRWVFCAQTHDRIEKTAIREWLDAYENVTRMKWTIPETAEVQYRLPDGTGVEMDIQFSMANDLQSAGKFKSDQLSGAWGVEMGEIESIAVFNMLKGSVGRWPPKDRRGDGNYWQGVLGDTNAMPEDHWWPELELKIRPPVELVEFFNQPPALLDAIPFNPDQPEYIPNEGQDPRWAAAENICNLTGGFGWYYNLISTYPREWVQVFVQNMYGSLSTRTPVYGEYRDAEHAKTGLQRWNGIPLRLGFDWGRTPCCLICQLDSHGQWRCLEEVCGKGISVQTFVKMQLGPVLLKRYSGIPIIAAADPAGFDKGQATDGTCAEQLEDIGIHVVPAPSNKEVPRREAVAGMLQTPGAFLLDPLLCPTLHAGFKGKYYVEEDGHFTKNDYSHIMNALEAIALHTRVNPQASSQKWNTASFFGAQAQRELGFGSPGSRRMVFQGGVLVPEGQSSPEQQTAWGTTDRQSYQDIQGDYDPLAHS